jgi:peptidoglycan-N-acetylglucosamine deacetylase
MTEKPQTGGYNRDLMKAMLFAGLPKRLLAKRGNPAKNAFALTFDDGPHPEFTPPLLDILHQHQIRATFFLLGEQAQRFPNLVRRIASAEHEIGSHAYSHANFNGLPWRDAVRQIREAKDILEQMTGRACRLFRPPYGKLAIQTLVPPWLEGQSVVLWSIDLKDFNAQSTEEIAQRLSATPIGNGDIVLYHAVKEAALRAVPYVIDAAKASGLGGETVSAVLWPRGNQ